MRKLLVAGAVLLVLAIAVRLWPDPKPVPRVSPTLEQIRDSTHISTERLQRLLADSIQWQQEVERQDSLEAAAVRSADESRRIRLSLRGRPAPSLPDTSPADTARLLAELDTVRQERDLAIQEADSLRVALEHADSSKPSLLWTVRSLQLAADQYLRSQLWAEGRLNQAVAMAKVIEKQNAALRRGCRVPLVGIPCPVFGPGLVLGTDLQPRLGIAVIIPL